MWLFQVVFRLLGIFMLQLCMETAMISGKRIEMSRVEDTFELIRANCLNYLRCDSFIVVFQANYGVESRADAIKGSTDSMLYHFAFQGVH